MPFAPQDHTTIAAPDAASHFSELLSKVGEGSEITITEGGRPVARLVPFAVRLPDVVGCMKGTFTITGDIVGPEPDVWDAMR